MGVLFFSLKTNYFHKCTERGHLWQWLSPEQTEPKAAIKNHQQSSEESLPQSLRFVCSNSGRRQNRPHRPAPEQQLPPRCPRPTSPYSWLLPESSVPVVLAQWLVPGRAWWSWSCLPSPHWLHLPQAAWALSIHTTFD